MHVLLYNSYDVMFEHAQYVVLECSEELGHRGGVSTSVMSMISIMSAQQCQLLVCACMYILLQKAILSL